MSADSKTCPGCHEPKGSRQIVCNVCWRGLPVKLREDFRQADPRQRWQRVAAVRAILTHVTRQPELDL